MRPWPAQHKNLAVITAMALLAFVGLYFVLLRPKQVEVAQAAAKAAELEKSIVQSGWPLDSARLVKINEEKGRDRVKAVTEMNDVLNLATGVFAKDIEKLFGSSNDFRSNVSRLDYKEEYNQMERHFSDDKIAVAEEVLRLGENSDSPYMYQLVLQLWTLRAVADLATRSQLRPAVMPVKEEPDGDRSGRKPPPARLTVLPLRAYVASADDKDPYLLECPVRLVLRGRVESLCAFLLSLTAKGSFFPITHLELRKVVPSYGDAPADLIEADVECSSFYRLRETVAKPRTPTATALPPRGA